MPPRCGISSHPFPHLILLCSSIILAFFQSAMSVAASPLTETRVPDSVAASGLGQLEFVRTGSRTIVTRVFATSPLRLLNPGNNGRAAWVYSSSYGGGLVDGDRVALDISASRGAEAYLSTQASTKVYRSPHGTCVDVNARVEEGATLLVLPDPVVCFTGARYRQAQHFHLSAQGSLVVADCLLSGRCASGERWEFLEYRSLLKITLDDRLLVHDALALRAEDGELMKRFDRFNALAVVAIVGRSFRESTNRLLAWSAAQTVAPRPEVLVTASNLSDEGCLLRIVGTSGEKVCCTIRTLLDFVPSWLGDDPWARKW